MKKLLGIFVFLVISILPVNFLYAKTFHKENSYIKIDLSVVGTKADISITNIYQNALRGNLAIFDTEPNTNYTNYVFYESNVDLLRGETKKIIYNELDASKNKKYTLIYRATNNQRTELPFSTFWYGIVKGDETADGGYVFSSFGDPTDTRDFSIILNKSLYPEGGDILSWINSSTIVPIGRFSGNTVGRTEEIPISVKQENGGRYYVGLVAKGTDNNVEMVTKYQDQLIFGSDKVGEIFFNKDLKYRKSGSSTFYLEGSVNVSKHKPADLIPLDKITVSGNIYTPDNTAVLAQLTPIKLELGSKGVYSFEVKTTSLDAGVWYPVNIIFESDTGAKIEYSEKFNTDKGIIPQTGKARDDFFDKNSYRLLAPIPGMIALLDPALCQLEQQTNPGQICDVNAFLNFILKLIIGLAAVVLVVRLIIEGYSYMITDTPFKKAAAKGAFKEALIGLVIALSSYLILNTINPRLVNNDLKIGVAEFDIKSIEDLGIDAPWTGPTIGLSGDIKKDLAKMNFPAGVFCPGKTGGSGDIATVAKSFINGNISHVTYNNNPGVRGSPGPSNTIYLDCSLYVNVVLGCAGITPKSAPSTFSMKPKGQEVKNIEVKTVNGIVKGYVNGVELHPGDLVGTNNGSHGHVWIYVGNGEILDSQVSNGKKVGGYTVGTTAMSVIKTKKLDMRPYSKVAPMNFVLRI